jgi:hypothetical protein
MEMYFYSPETEDNGGYQEQQIETDQMPVNAVAQDQNDNNRGRHRWNSLKKVKNRLNSLGKGMH